MPLKPHPLAEIFPVMEGAELAAFCLDIQTHGLREPITLHEKKILDGRNRYNACIETNTEPRFLEYVGDDPLGFVISLNVKRRHLVESQRAMVAAMIATLPSGTNRSKGPPIGGASQDEAAEMLNISVRSLQRAAVVRDHGEPELIQAVHRGKLDVHPASLAARLAPALQRQVAELAISGNVNVVRTVLKQHLRTVREEELGTKQLALPDKKYGVILADPEWSFDVWSHKTGFDRAADNHYPTSTLEAIKSRDVASIAADDCALFLWGTVPMLPQALEVMASWGFAYRSMATWVKDKVGTGFWLRNKSEHLLIGTRGAIPAPAMGTQWPSAIEAPVGDHSAKPEVFLEMIEAYFPSLPKIELNRRGPPRQGWDSWGLEAEPAAA